MQRRNIYSKLNEGISNTFTNIFKHSTHRFTKLKHTTTFTTLAYEGDLSQHFCSTSNKNYVTSPRLKQIDKLLENMFICLFKTTQPTHTLKLCRKENSLFSALRLTFLLLTLMSTSTSRYFCLHANETY